MPVVLHVKSQRKLECLCSSLLLLRSFNSRRQRNSHPIFILDVQVRWRRRDHKMPDGQDTIQGTSIHFSRVTRWENYHFRISFTHLKSKYHFNNALWYQAKHQQSQYCHFRAVSHFYFHFLIRLKLDHVLKILINFVGTIWPLQPSSLSNFIHYSEQNNQYHFKYINLSYLIGTTPAITSVRQTMVSETALLPRKSGSKFTVSFSRKNYFLLIYWYSFDILIFFWYILIFFWYLDIPFIYWSFVKFSQFCFSSDAPHVEALSSQLFTGWVLFYSLNHNHNLIFTFVSQKFLSFFGK